jgi:hypothetical protein
MIRALKNNAQAPNFEAAVSAPVVRDVLPTDGRNRLNVCSRNRQNVCSRNRQNAESVTVLMMCQGIFILRCDRFNYAVRRHMKAKR